ncbi:DEAD/DEAH box helicase [Clostridium brassicae]|uniref:SNF2-related protein n=1 Tax=Clostridium brassicae TaxID=2999072 RepID=A0ABT4DGQ2_9CLOT|nr:SNF2-related protein [Clostridium brassicae]MCY6960286.1 SNF2-related protein [Clostridium brassicae]
MEKVILSPSSDLMRGLGKDVFKKNLVTNIRGKKIDNMYHIYGNVLNELKAREFSTHIKIDLINKNVTFVKCSCDQFEEFSKNKKLFMCEHLTATAYKFLSVYYKKKEKKDRLSEEVYTVKNYGQKGVYKKNNNINKGNRDINTNINANINDDTNKSQIINRNNGKLNNNNKLESIDKKDNIHEKLEVSIDVRLTYKSWKIPSDYEAEFFIEFGRKYLINDFKKFISDLDARENIFFSNKFIYSPTKYRISSKDTKIIGFIKDYIYKNKGEFFEKRKLIIEESKLRGFLEVIGERKIQFKYNGVEYKPIINRKNLPVSFTLKDRDEHLVLTTHKKLPVPLNKNKDVYLWDRNIYLPSKNQTDKYNSLYDSFKIKGEILYKKTLDNYNKILSRISDISNNINLSEGVKRFLVDCFKLEFLIYKEKEIYCIPIGIYFDKKIDMLKDKLDEKLIIRDLDREEKVLMQLEQYKFKKDKDKLIFIGGDEELFHILNNKGYGIHSLGNVILGKGFEDIKVYNSDFIEMNLYEEEGYFKFSYNIGNVERREFRNILKSYKENDRFYKTKDNKFIDFEEEGIIKFFNLIEILNLDENIDDDSITIEKGKILYIEDYVENSCIKFKDGLNLLKDIKNQLYIIENKPAQIPEDLNATLREYQVSGFKWFKNLSELQFGGILSDEMGLGKTVQTIAFLLSEKNKNSLIVAPTSLIYNWKEEIERFAPTLKIGIVHGRGNKKVIENFKEYDVILTTYGTLKNNIEDYNDMEFDYFIIDEAQNIKNPLSQNTKSVKKIKAKVKFALTGTPIENNLTELWSIFDFIMPGYLYSKEIFNEKFVLKSEANLESLKLLIKPFILRRTKKEVIKDLPDKIEKKILVDMTPTQKAIYASYIRDIRSKIKSNAQDKIEILSYLMKLRQICLDPSLIFKQYKKQSGKLKIAMKLVEKQIKDNGKVLLFSQFTSVLKKIGKSLEEKGIEYLYLDGSTHSKERIRLVNEFNNSDEIRVFLISLKAGGTGLNLTSANLVIHFDPWWNPAVENQATDRAHRIGQRNIVEVIKLVSRGTIEEKIISMQEDKKELIDSVLTGELKNSNNLTELLKDPSFLF